MEVFYTAAILFVFVPSSVQSFDLDKVQPLDFDVPLTAKNTNKKSLHSGRRPYGTYLYEGDIVMPLDAVPDEQISKAWPGGIIPFVIDCSLQARPAFYLNTLKQAMKSWQEKTSGCIRFIPKRRQDKVYVRFAKGNSCSSGGVGFVGRTYTMTMKDGCDHVNVMEHELGHVIGFWHEQTRPDRDRYIDIFWRNIKPGLRHNFRINLRSTINIQGKAYDYNSIMHYPKNAFGLHKNAITMLPKNRNRVTHPYETISEMDVRQTLKMYKCFLPVIPNCKDWHSSCPKWAASGYCKSNPGSALRTCRKSCGLCKGLCVDKGKCRRRNCHYASRRIMYDTITRCKKTCRICKPEFKAKVKPTTTPSPISVKATSKITKPRPIRHPFPFVPVPKYNGMKCQTEYEKCREFSSKHCNQPWIQKNCYNLCKDVVYLEEPLCDKVEIKARGRCSEPFGISAFHNRNSSIPFELQSISPHYITNNHFHAPPREARLYNQPSVVGRHLGSWCAKPGSYYKMNYGYEDYLEIKFDRQRTVGSLATQGRPGTFEHTKTYKLRFYDKNGRSWWYKESWGKTKIFQGNCHNEVPVINYLKQPQTAVKMRIYPLKYAGARCLRVELYGC